MTLNTATIMDAMVDTDFLCNKAAILRDMTRYTIQQISNKNMKLNTHSWYGSKTAKLMSTGLWQWAYVMLWDRQR